MASDVGSDVGSQDRPRARDPARGSQTRADAGADLATGGPATRPPLSVVIPTYNEEDRIETCLESVFEACGDEPSTEVIVVDSNSTDRTVERAREYPVTVLRIPDDDLTTPGAGRYVGQRHADGEQLLFVDGDMRISGEWLDRARTVVQQRDDVAGVDGHLNAAAAATEEPVEALRGVALYDAAVLERVDGFDPFLHALEDIELGFRITEAGYDVRRLPMVAASHPYAPGASELLRRWRNGYYFGIGQAARKHLRSPRTLGKFARRYRYRVAFYGWTVAGAAAAVVQPVLAVAWLAVSTVLFAVDVAWEGPGDATTRLGKYLLSTVGFAVGFAGWPRDRDEFPVEAAECLQESDGATASRPTRADGGDG